MRSRRSSTSARASGLWKGRCGRVTSTGSLLPVLPETLVALSVIVTLAPAHGCSERSIVALASPAPLAVAGGFKAGLRAAARGSAAPSPTDRAAGEIGARARDPVAVLDPVGERQRSAEVGLRAPWSARCVGTPAGITEKATSAALAPGARIVARPSPWIVQRRSTGAPAAGLRLVLDRRDRALDLGLDHPRLAAHHEHRILVRRHGLRRARRRRRSPPADGRRKGADRSRRRSGSRPRRARRLRRASRRRRRGARKAPGRRRPPRRTPSSPRRTAGRRGRARPCAARAGRRASPRPTARAAPDGPPTAPAPSDRRRWRACRRARWPAGARAPESRSSRAAMSRAAGQRSLRSGASAASEPEPEQGDAGDAQGARGEEPERRARRRRGTGSSRRSQPRSAARPARRASARAAACDRAVSLPAGAASGGLVALGLVRLRHARPDRLRKANPHSTKAEVCRGRSCLRNSAAAGRSRSLRP